MYNPVDKNAGASHANSGGNASALAPTPATAPGSLSSFLAEVDRRAADIERAERASVTRSIAARPINATPRALVLVVTVATCECGAVHRNINPNVMVRYDSAGFANAIHYRRRDVQHFLALPREIKLHELAVPFCERCFDGAPSAD